MPDDLLKEIKQRQERDLKKNPHNTFKAKDFDLNSFKIFNEKKYLYKNDYTYFIRIPNKFIQTNIQKTFGVNRILLVVFCEIDRNRSYEDISYVTVGEIFKKCKYKISRHKPKIFYEILKCLLFLKENNYIECEFDSYEISYNDCIKVKIIKEVFDSKSNFTILTGKSLDFIYDSNINVSIESILTVFLYINSYIGCRSKNMDEKYCKENPEAFWRSIECMADDLSMSKDTINQCLNYLTSNEDNHSALLVKEEVGSVQPDKSKPPKNAPNIYVLNKEGYEKEIKWALNKMLEIYKVDKFFPVKNGNFRFIEE